MKFANENSDDWDSYISTALFAYRTKRHNITRHEPFFLMYGREVVILPIEFKVATNEILSAENDLHEDLLKRVQIIFGKMAVKQSIT